MTRIEETTIEGYRVISLVNEESGVRVSIAPQSGGEVSSFQIRWEGEWIELLYRANQFAPPESGWRGRAPWMFPAVGRNYAEEQLNRIKISGEDEWMGTYRLGDKLYSIPCHGFVKDSAWEATIDINQEAPAVVCVTRSTEETRIYYPFNYQLSINYALSSKGYIATVQVLADPRNQDDMIFSLGNHITLVAPFTSTGNADNCLVRTTASQKHLISKQNLLSGKTEPVDYTRGVALRDDPTLSDLALSQFAGDEYAVDFIDPSSFGLRVQQSEVVPRGALPKASPESHYAVFYSPSDHSFYCPEPWYGGPNSLNEQKGIVKLKPGESFSWEMTVMVISQE